MIWARLAHRVMSLEQRGKVSTQITITQRPQGQRGKIAIGGDFLGYGALKTFKNTLLEAPQALFCSFNANRQL